MISCDTSALEAQLKKITEESERKMRGMVEVFTYNIAVEAIDNTPIGHIGPQNEWMYHLNKRMAYLPPVVGSAKGGWILSLNNPSSVTFPDQADGPNATNIKSEADRASQGYKLGDTVYVTNSGAYVSKTGWTLPKFGALEHGYSSQAPNGIMAPTLDKVMTVYNLNLKKYYEGS